MLLKFTNATKDRVGDGLILNTDLIVSFFKHTQEDGTLVTVAFGMNNNTWEILETIDQIEEMISSARK